LVGYRAGERIIDLAERFGVHRSTVLAQLRRQNEPRRSEASRWSEKELASAVQRYTEGALLAEIAATYGIHQSTVGSRLRAAGVRMRVR